MFRLGVRGQGNSTSVTVRALKVSGYLRGPDVLLKQEDPFYSLNLVVWWVRSKVFRPGSVRL